MAQRKKTGRELGTQAKFKLKGGLKPIRKFDDSDLSKLRNSSGDVKPKGNNSESGSVVPRSVPSHLLMISILEHLCFMYTKNGVTANKLFKVLCEQLTKLRVMSPLSGIDEMSGIRAHYRTSVHNMIQAAMTDLYKKGEILALPPTKEFVNLKLKHQLTRVRTEDLINMQTSRYDHEFIQLGILGKGGFGSVYKVQNRLDGRNYAVKKIRFKHKKPEHLLKVLKEVKALANFQHTNIVGYNAAWLEYDFPSTHSSRSSSSLGDHSVSHDKSFSYIEAGNSSSIDVEFRLDSGSEDELDNINGKIIHKHFNSSKCTITEITEIMSPRKSPDKNDVHKLRLSSSKEIIKNMIPIVPGNYLNARFLDNIPEGHSRYENIHAKKGDSFTVAIEKNCDSSDSSDIIFLDDSAEIPNSSSQNLVGHGQQNVSQSASENSNYEQLRNHGENESTSSLESLRNIQDSSNVCVNDKPTIFRNQISHNYCIQASTDAQSTGINIPKIKKEENSTPSSVSPKNRLVPFRRSISAEPLSNKNVVNDFNEYSDDNFPYQATISLYIQMELCEQTLQMWLLDRNSKLAGVEDLKQYKEENMRIIHQILTGVNYIHSLGLIHRDLKPRNIFLLGNNLHVKIGDFGLATEDVIRGEVKDTILTPSPDIKAYFKYDNLTSGVGTEMYAAPEQLDGNHYDSKSDIYSIGVILFEVFQVFKTEMERLISIKKLRRGTIPDLKSFWPDVAQAIQAMTSVNVSDRPTAECLLDSQLYLSKDQMIVSLQKQLAEKSDYITQLEKQMQEKDDLNYKLKIKLDQLSSSFDECVLDEQFMLNVSP